MTQSEKYHILIVDDNAPNLILMKRYLQDEFAVETAENGKDALNLLSHGNIDLVLLDVMMPHLNGTTVLKIIRDSPNLSTLPVIFISAMPRHEYIEKGYTELGESDYFVKPMDFDRCIARIYEILGERT